LPVKEISVILLEAQVLGGIQLMTADTISALARHGYRVTLVTSRLSKAFLDYVRNYGSSEFRVEKLPYFTPNSTLNMAIARFLRSKKARGLSVNMHGDLQPIPADVVYFHQFNVDYRVRSPLALTPVIQVELRRKFMEEIRDSVVLVNSSWTMSEALYFWGIRARILYPPVHLERIGELKLEGREDRVITISRFSRDRGLEYAVEAAGQLGFQFVIAGYVQDPYYFRELLSMKGKNVILIPNLDEGIKSSLLSTSKVYYNPTPYVEGFGTAVVEGMAAGLIPVTRDVGGVVDFAPERFRFHLFPESVERIQEAVNSWNGSEAEKMRRIAQRFSMERYEAELLELIEGLT
jgi:glycosyltransferase involved in cell wall biosynthesis